MFCVLLYITQPLWFILRCWGLAIFAISCATLQQKNHINLLQNWECLIATLKHTKKPLKNDNVSFSSVIKISNCCNSTPYTNTTNTTEHAAFFIWKIYSILYKTIGLVIWRLNFIVLSYMLSKPKLHTHLLGIQLHWLFSDTVITEKWLELLI